MGLIIFSVGLLVILAVFAVGLFFRRYVAPMIYLETSILDADAVKMSKIEKAETASATVLALSYPEEDSKLYSLKKDFINTIIKLEVLPPVGSCYQASVKWEVDKYFLPKINPGSVLKVKVDEKDSTIIYPFGNWAYLNESLN